MCGGGNNDAVEQAEREEAQRREQINATVSRINEIFGSDERQAQYGDYRGAYYDRQKLDLDDAYEQARRNLAFSLARSGQTGGSVAAGYRADAAETYDKGLLTASQTAREAASKLRAADNQTRRELIAAAQAGLSATQANQLAAYGLESNLERAESLITPQTLSDLFGVAGEYYRRSLVQPREQVNDPKKPSPWARFGGP